MLDSIEDEPVIWQSSRMLDANRRIPRWALPLFMLLFGAGMFSFVIKPILALLILALDGACIFLVIKNRKPATVFALTPKRAIVLEVKGSQKNVVRHCNLSNVTASVMNRRMEQLTYSTPIGAQSSSTGTHDIGDVLFFSNGQLQLKFDYIRNPDSVIELVNAVNKQETVLPVVEAIRESKSLEERELWSYGPIIVHLQFLEPNSEQRWGDTLRGKSVYVRYVLTSTRAYITGAGGEGKIKAFNLVDFYKTAYNISHPKMATKKIMVAQSWNGGLIVECSLSDVQTVITNRSETGIAGAKNNKSIGNINFLTGGRIVLTFERVEDPDGVISEINHLLKQRL